MTVKLETAYRKLWPHRHRWHLHIRPGHGESRTVIIEAEFSTSTGMELPSHIKSRYIVVENGLANAMNRMACKLDHIERSIILHNESLGHARKGLIA